jgi:L-2-hydroxyglutarate oxidase LhgO
MLYAYCAEAQIPHSKVGKLVVATCPSHLPRLSLLAQQAISNGVSDVTVLSSKEVRFSSPFLKVSFE